MPKPVSATFILPAILGAAVAGYLLADHGSATAAAPASAAPAETAAPATPPTAALPPNHPHVPGMPPHAQHGGGAMPNGENQRPPSIEWKVPADWQTLPNPSPMRLATYRAGDGAELSIARAGGPVDANVLRWQQQFEGTPQAERSEKDVRGLHVTVVRIAGTYDASGMSSTAPEKHDGWAMLAAIVEAPGAPYFFKLLGPAAQVDKVRGSFNGLVDSVAPRAAQ
ncbi:MAG: hypothetical protein ACLQVI_11055 [Polyangiaceae bacterium]|jgi:hypothetical protein